MDANATTYQAARDIGEAHYTCESAGMAIRLLASNADFRR